jgi:hypothetical protein
METQIFYFTIYAKNIIFKKIIKKKLKILQDIINKSIYN